jgi:hypothetical protein
VLLLVLKQLFHIVYIFYFSRVCTHTQSTAQSNGRFLADYYLGAAVRLLLSKRGHITARREKDKRFSFFFIFRLISTATTITSLHTILL